MEFQMLKTDICYAIDQLIGAAVNLSHDGDTVVLEEHHLGAVLHGII